MDRSGMRERRNLISASARCIKNKYFRWILNICPLNFSKKINSKRLIFLLQLLNKGKTIATKTKTKDSIFI